jgi:hypothetical protein
VSNSRWGTFLTELNLTLPPQIWTNGAKKQFQIRWAHRFESDDDEVFFALCYPWRYDECQSRLEVIESIHCPLSGGTGGESPPVPVSENAADPSKIYFHRELLVNSLEGRRVDLITLSDHHGIQPEREALFGQPQLFPDSKRGHVRPQKFAGKRVVFVSARVHPGETPASFVFNGVLEFLLREDDPRAQRLREMFIFKMIPILNPDGVVRGHYRTDTRGVNLNRCYLDPNFEEHPSIFAAKAAVLDAHSQGLLHVYLDLHAHATKRGCFMYGNELPNLDDQVQNRLLVRLMSCNTPHLEYEACNFSGKNMKGAGSISE